MITCRGKNGWFNLGKVTVFKLGEEMAVGIGSKKSWVNVSPIHLQGPKAEIVNLLAGLKAMVEGDPCGMFELRSSEEPTVPKCSGGTNPELCACCHFKMDEEVLNDE
jgi:hypothetical protein